MYSYNSGWGSKLSINDNALLLYKLKFYKWYLYGAIIISNIAVNNMVNLTSL